MTDAALLTMLETSLELILDYMDDAAKTSKEAELLQYIHAAEKYIAEQGITLDRNEIGDCMLITLYAGWLYDKRKSGDAKMPRMLRYQLNNRLFHEKMGANA